MPYEYISSTAFPRLLILLTDELEESVKLVNSLIESTIEINFDRDAPKNRCYISVIGYSNNVKELCFGWLRDLDTNPLRVERQKTIEVEVQQPVWIESVKTLSSVHKYADAVLLASELSQKWSDDQSMSPIIIDCSEENHADSAKEEIKRLCSIVAKDGRALFFGCYSKNEDVFNLFSKMPDEWEYRFKEWELKEEDYRRGLLNREHIGSIFSAMMRSGGMACINGFKL